MYELIQVSQNDYYIQCPARIGLIRVAPDRVCLIDSGNDKDAGKRVKRLLDANGWRLDAIYNTHAHADHIGGNRYLQSQTGCRVYAPGIEADFAARPVLEPSYLFGGNPPAVLRHKFLMAQPSDALPLTADALPAGVEIVPLPGHAFDMAGFRTAEGVVYLADCLSSAETLEKYQIAFLVDPGRYAETLERVKGMAAEWFIPAHAEPARDIAPLAQANIDKVRQIAARILDICAEPSGFESILKALFDGFGLRMTFEQHALVGSTVRSYLAWLSDAGRLRAEFCDNRLLWRAV